MVSRSCPGFMDTSSLFGTRGRQIVALVRSGWVASLAYEFDASTATV